MRRFEWHSLLQEIVVSEISKSFHFSGTSTFVYSIHLFYFYTVLYCPSLLKQLHLGSLKSRKTLE